MAHSPEGAQQWVRGAWETPGGPPQSSWCWPSPGGREALMVLPEQGIPAEREDGQGSPGRALCWRSASPSSGQSGCSGPADRASPRPTLPALRAPPGARVVFQAPSRAAARLGPHTLSSRARCGAERLHSLFARS